MLLEIAERILATGKVCDHCLGRQFGSLLSGYTNAERGHSIRLFLAMSLDAGQKLNVDMNNFYDFKFRHQKIKAEKKDCWVCGEIFQNLGKIVEKVLKAIDKIEFKTFHIGIVLSKKLVKAEEKLWEEVGAEWCESIKTELSRELGKALSEKIKKRAEVKVELKRPDIVILIDLEKNKVELQISPVFVYGRYKKFAEMPQTKFYCRICRGRGCAQCDWTGKLWESSVEERIGKTFMGKTKAVDTTMHASGREDIDVRCLAWREFVLEIIEPKRRSLNIKAIEKEINRINKGKISVSSLRLSNKEEVRAVKEKMQDKTYRAVIELEKKISKKELSKLKKLKGTIEQLTPSRVLRRRADILRKKAVRNLKYNLAGKKLILEMKAQSGLYIKELITGDNGRTKPSASELLKQKLKIKKLEIIKIG